MTASNLGIVFGPALLRKEIEDVKQMVADSPLVINSIKIIVEECDYFFEQGQLIGEKTMEQNDSKNEPKEDSNTSPVEESTFQSRNPELHSKFRENEEEFAKFQEALLSVIQLLKRNIKLIISDLENPKNFTPEDIQSLNTLINSFHTVCFFSCLFFVTHSFFFFVS